jgi:hypothetical protein
VTRWAGEWCQGYTARWGNGWRAHQRGSFHGGAARSEGNDGEGQRPVVVIGSSQFGKVVRARAVVGVASMEREGSW